MSGGPGQVPDLDIDVELSTRMLQRFVREELERTGLERIVIGLSGGIDSAVAAAIAVRALGAERLLAVRMPHRSSSPDSLADAQLLIERLGLPSETIDITPMVDAFVQIAGRGDANRIGNVMARCRMIVLFDRSAAERALVLGTSNKTELMLGYGTLHGDLASAINPLGDLYKTQVRQLAVHLAVPEPIITKPPSADLWPGQSDEAELGASYEQVDPVLACLIDARMSRDAIVEAGFPAELVDRIAATVHRTQFKRRLPLIAKMSTRSIGWDFRYPRDWKS